VEIEQALPRFSTRPEDQDVVERVMNAYFILTAPKHLTKCPNCMMHIDPGDNKKCTCLCGVTFCAVCGRSPYHFHTTCNEVVFFSQKYNEWQFHGREQRLKSRAENEAAYAKALEQYEADRVRHEQEATAARQRLEEYKKDEMWKAENCRCCPHCHKPVSKIEGCDAMRCGYDTDTKNNQQPGCGKSFDWGKAPPYKPQITPSLGPVVPKINKSKPAQLEVLHQWMIEEGEPLRCDGCHAAIVGLRFDCINCPSFSCCEICNAKIDIGCCDNHPSRGHIFKIVQSPQQAEQPADPSESEGELGIRVKDAIGHKVLLEWTPPDWVAPVKDLESRRTLVLKQSDGKKTVHKIGDKPFVVIGRKDPTGQAEIFLEASLASRNHAAILQNARGEYYIVDLHSANGTFIGKEKRQLVPNKPYEWSVMDPKKVRFGPGGSLGSAVLNHADWDASQSSDWVDRKREYRNHDDGGEPSAKRSRVLTGASFHERALQYLRKAGQTNLKDLCKALGIKKMDRQSKEYEELVSVLKEILEKIPDQSIFKLKPEFQSPDIPCEAASVPSRSSGYDSKGHVCGLRDLENESQAKG